jgi:hypothetical protein
MRFFPQKHFTHKAKIVLPSSLVSGYSTPIDPALRHQVRQKLESGLWTSITSRNWDQFDLLLQEFPRNGISHDEVSYTMMAHGYLLSHRHVSSNALLVIEEMKTADMHPAIIALNERLILSHLAFVNAGIRPYSYNWQNFARLAWMSAARLRNSRARMIKTHLQALPAEVVIDRISANDVRKMIANEHEHARSIVQNEYDLLERESETLNLDDLEIYEKLSE